MELGWVPACARSRRSRGGGILVINTSINVASTFAVIVHSSVGGLDQVENRVLANLQFLFVFCLKAWIWLGYIITCFLFSWFASTLFFSLFASKLADVEVTYFDSQLFVLLFWLLLYLKKYVLVGWIPQSLLLLRFFASKCRWLCAHVFDWARTRQLAHNGSIQLT